MTSVNHHKRTDQMPLLRQARSEGKVDFFSHTRLVVRERYADYAPRHDNVDMRQTASVHVTVGAHVMTDAISMAPNEGALRGGVPVSRSVNPGVCSVTSAPDASGAPVTGSSNVVSEGGAVGSGDCATGGLVAASDAATGVTGDAASP